MSYSQFIFIKLIKKLVNIEYVLNFNSYATSAKNVALYSSQKFL